MLHKDKWDQYKVDFQITSREAFDEKLGKECLDVRDNISKKITRYYYEYVEAEILRTMPQDKLEDLKGKVDEILAQRAASQS